MAGTPANAYEFWPHVLEAVKNRRRYPWILLAQHTKVLSFDGATLTLSTPNQGLHDSLVNSGSCDVLNEAFDQVLHTRPVVELLVEGGAPLALPRSTPQGAATKVQVSVAVTAAETSNNSIAAATHTLHRILAQTAFLIHEQGNNQAAELLADVEDVELVPGNRFGDWQDAVLIVPPYLVPRFTETVTAAIQPVFEHVAGRHGLEIGGVTAAPALPDIGDDWRRVLQERLAKEAASNQASRTRGKGVAPGLSREGFVFDSREEVLVYEALKRAQAALPEDVHPFHLPAAAGTRRHRQRLDAGLPHRCRWQGGNHRGRRTPPQWVASALTPPATGTGATAGSSTSNAFWSRRPALTAILTRSSGSSSHDYVNTADAPLLRGRKEREGAVSGATA
ncbi:hypothetical protein ACIQMZ_34530 [Streptomyces longwoodensis]|uniref:hypothetical protein n=1 Tax=Streptomyces longwoodensis TaxID=68231 RepID=UPI00381319B0